MSTVPDGDSDDTTQTHVTLTSGTMVSHYRIIEKIGAGGMGKFGRGSLPDSGASVTTEGFNSLSAYASRERRTGNGNMLASS